MPTLDTLVDEFLAMVEGGVDTSESKFSDTYLESLIHQARGIVVREMRMVAPPDILYQKEFPEYSGIVQSADSCYVEFNCPAPLAMYVGDGLKYVGNVNELDNFSRYGWGGASKSVLSKHRLGKADSINKTLWDFKVDETGYSKVQIYNNENIEEILVMGIFADPTQVSTYRRDTDIYPISMDMIDLVKQAAFKLLVNQANSPANIVDDGADIYSQGASNSRKR